MELARSFQTSLWDRIAWPASMATLCVLMCLGLSYIDTSWSLYDCYRFTSVDCCDSILNNLSLSFGPRQKEDLEVKAAHYSLSLNQASKSEEKYAMS
mgnify:CR=1 FL=1